MNTVYRWPDHTEATTQPFISEDFVSIDLMIEHLAETMVLPEEKDSRLCQTYPNKSRLCTLTFAG